MTTTIEKAYRAAWNERNPAERVQRVCMLFAEIQQLVEQRIREQMGALPQTAMRREIAKRLYLMDPQIQRLLEKCGDP